MRDTTAKLLRSALASALVGACAPKAGDMTEDTGTDTTGPGTDATDGHDTGTTTDTPTTGTPTTGTPTTGEGTTGEGDLCAAYCAAAEACDGFGGEACVEACVQELAGFGWVSAECRGLNEAYFECRTGLSCEEMQGGGCDDVYFATQVEACTRPACDALTARVVECGLVPADLQLARALECSYALASAFVDRGEACALATEAMHTCGAETLTCEQIDQGVGCEAEEAEAEAICGV